MANFHRENWNLQYEQIKIKLENGVLLTRREDYTGLQTVIEYRCEFFSIHENRAIIVLKRKRACTCQKRLPPPNKLTDNEVRKRCLKAGFVWSGTNYTKYFEPLTELRCKPNGHLQLGRSLGHIEVSNGCSKCRFFLREEICRAAIEKITGKPFPKMRLKRIAGLELDGYCEEIGVAFEHNGEFHYGLVEFGDYKQIRKRDAIKRRLARRNGIRIVTITYRVKKANIPMTIFNELKRRNIPIVVSKAPSIEDLNIKVHSLIDETELCRRNGKIVSPLIEGDRDRVRFECLKHKNQFEMAVNDFRYGSWGCKFCISDRISKALRFTICDINVEFNRLGYTWECIEEFEADGERRQKYKCTKCDNIVVSYYRRMRMGLLCPSCTSKRQVWDETTKAKIIEMRSRGESRRAIALAIDRPEKAVISFLKTRKIYKPKVVPPLYKSCKLCNVTMLNNEEKFRWTSKAKTWLGNNCRDCTNRLKRQRRAEENIQKHNLDPWSLER